MRVLVRLILLVVCGCVLWARAVFGVLWCSLVVGWWAGAAGVGGVKVDVLLGSGPGSGYVRSVVSGGAASPGGGVVLSGLFSFSLSPVSARGSASLRSPVGGGRVWRGVWCACA